MLTHQIQLENLEITNGKMFVFKVDWIAWAHTQNVLCIFGLSLSLCLFNVSFRLTIFLINRQLDDKDTNLKHEFDIFF